MVTKELCDTQLDRDVLYNESRERSRRRGIFLDIVNEKEMCYCREKKLSHLENK